MLLRQVFFTPVPFGPKRKPPIERCWRFIEPDESTHCWIWTGDLSDGGYGSIWDIRKVLNAHKVIWEYVFGQVPKGYELHHRCERRKCVNPFHLQCLTRLEHVMKARSGPIVANRGKTHCDKGHPLSGGNLHIEKGGGRRCIACRREKFKRWYLRDGNGKKSYKKNRESVLQKNRDRYISDSEFRRKKIEAARKYYQRTHATLP